MEKVSGGMERYFIFPLFLCIRKMKTGLDKMAWMM
jgi:hypothetical protein